jgi:microcystin-dependent protein
VSPCSALRYRIIPKQLSDKGVNVSEPFLSEVRMFGFNFAPRGWALCDGQILPIQQNQSLYSLLGTTYGGDGRTTFGLPDLRGRTPIHFDSTFRLGQKSGEESTNLALAQIPSHNHNVSTTGDQGAATSIGAPGSPPDTDNNLNNVLASQARGGKPFYSNADNLTAMHNGTISSTGGGQAHNNMQPSKTVSFAIALTGVFPSRN